MRFLPILVTLLLTSVTLPAELSAQNSQFSTQTLAGQAAHAIGRGDDLLPFPMNLGNFFRRVTRNLGVENDVTDNIGDTINLCLSVSYVPVEESCSIVLPAVVDAAVVCYEAGDLTCGLIGDGVCAAGDGIGDAATWVGGAASDTGQWIGGAADTVCCVFGDIFGGSSSGEPSKVCNAPYAVTPSEPSICGNGEVEPGEECDGQGSCPSLDFPICTSTCTCKESRSFRGTDPLGEELLER